MDWVSPWLSFGGAEQSAPEGSELVDPMRAIADCDSARGMWGSFRDSVPCHIDLNGHEAAEPMLLSASIAASGTA